VLPAKDAATLVEPKQLARLGTVVCKKLADVPRATAADAATDVLCGLLSLVRNILESGGEAAVAEGCKILEKALGDGGGIGSGLKKMVLGSVPPLASLATVVFEEFLFATVAKPICQTPNRCVRVIHRASEAVQKRIVGANARSPPLVSLSPLPPLPYLPYPPPPPLLPPLTSTHPPQPQAGVLRPSRVRAPRQGARDEARAGPDRGDGEAGQRVPP
jgi:hypothetical protein